MKSVFDSIYNYFLGTIRGLKAYFRSVFSSLPYLFNLSSAEYRKEVTEQYPDPISSRMADDLPARSRGLLFNEIDKCTGCGNCEELCPTRCIYIENEIGADTSKTWVSVFDIDMSRCIFCGMCVEVCHPGSLVHTKKYEGAVYQMNDLVSSFGRGRVTPEQRAKWAEKRTRAKNEKQGDFKWT